LHGVLHRLGVIGAPTVLKQLITFMMLSMGTISMNLDAVENFAGEQAVTFQNLSSKCLLCVWIVDFVFIGSCMKY